MAEAHTHAHATLCVVYAAGLCARLSPPAEAAIANTGEQLAALTAVARQYRDARLQTGQPGAGGLSWQVWSLFLRSSGKHRQRYLRALASTLLKASRLLACCCPRIGLHQAFMDQSGDPRTARCSAVADRVKWQDWSDTTLVKVQCLWGWGGIARTHPRSTFSLPAASAEPAVPLTAWQGRHAQEQALSVVALRLPAPVRCAFVVLLASSAATPVC